MTTDPWPDEPEEPDPEARWGDPETRWGDPEARWGDPERELVENVTISTEQGSEMDISTDGVDGELSRLFWASVVLVNLAVFALSLGPMLIYFRGEWLLGLGLVGGGTLALGRTYGLYREFKRESGDDGEEEPDDESSEDTADVATGDGTEPTGPERNS